MPYNEENQFFLGDFDDRMESELTIPLTREIQKQKRFKDGRIDLWINSFGGYGHLVSHYIELVEMAKREGVIVRTIVPGVAFSAGSMLAITGTPGERYIAKGGEHLIHFGSVATQESTPKQTERWAGFKLRDFQNTLALYKKYANVPDIDIEMLDDGFSVPAAKCIKWKLADKYLDKYDIGDYVE